MPLFVAIIIFAIVAFIGGVNRLAAAPQAAPAADPGYIDIGNGLHATIDREHGAICYTKENGGPALSCIPYTPKD